MRCAVNIDFTIYSAFCNFQNTKNTLNKKIFNFSMFTGFVACKFRTILNYICM